jgi:ABC-type cobalamin transport system permease subunit
MKPNRKRIKMIYNRSSNQIATLNFKAVAMALSVALLLLNILRAVDMQTQMLLLGIGLACIAPVNLDSEKGS